MSAPTLTWSCSGPVPFPAASPAPRCAFCCSTAGRRFAVPDPSHRIGTQPPSIFSLVFLIKELQFFPQALILLFRIGHPHLHQFVVVPDIDLQFVITAPLRSSGLWPGEKPPLRWTAAQTPCFSKRTVRRTYTATFQNAWKKTVPTGCSSTLRTSKKLVRVGVRVKWTQKSPWNRVVPGVWVAADEGFEPSQTESESGVLPLH